MSSGDLHPDFVAAPAAARWKGRLDALWTTLSTEATTSRTSIEDVHAGRGWYWRIRFDAPLLDRELRTAGWPGLDRDRSGRIVQREVDLFGIWSSCEARTLESAALRFAGIRLEDAHSAAADAEVLPSVLAGMCGAFGLSTGRLDELLELSRRKDAVDRDGKFVKDEDGVIRFGFGKHKGAAVHDAPDYLEWMLGKDFSPETLDFARDFLLQARMGVAPHG